jgi:hypothetical protein
LTKIKLQALFATRYLTIKNKRKEEKKERRRNLKIMRGRNEVIS